MNLNKEQRCAVESNHSKILCLAGAGTGKTQTMISRICRLVNEGVNIRNILALTFTNAAAFEMQERFKKLSGRDDSPEFRTFHSFCYSLIAADVKVRNEIGYSSVPSIAEESEIQRIELSCRNLLGIKKSMKSLKYSNNLTDRNNLKLLEKSMKKEFKKRNLITFDILCYDVCMLFVNDVPSVHRYKNKYQYIFVDEFQDTDPKQWNFVKSFQESNLFIVGDALQAIYKFRGADSSIIKSLSRDDSWEVIRLVQNYRSTQKICACANRLSSTYADPSYSVDIVSTKDAGDDVTWKRTNTSRYILVSQVDELLGDWKLHNEPECAILCRTNSEVDQLADILTDKGVSFSRKSKDNHIEHFIKSLDDDKYALYWLLSILPSSEQSKFLRSESISDSEELDPQVKLIRFISTYSTGKILTWWKLIMECRKAASCNDISSIIRMFTSVDDRVSYFAEDLDKLSTYDDIRNYVLEHMNKSEESKIYVGTIHSSKGLEYNTVYLLNVGSPSFKLNGEENNNLFYVGITRAKERLYIA